VFSAALWQLELEDELVYVGDDGTTEDKGPSRRRGVDLSARYQIVEWLFADADVNLSQNVFVNKFFGDELIEENLVPLAPTLTSTGGITALHPNGWEGSLRYRYIKDRPANESNTVTAEGYSVIDLGMGYHTPFWRVGLNIENLLNTEWNEAQFDTESRLFDEPAPVDELHFTPGTPLAVRLSASYYF
jgi:outer membrane receptor protein involved in Fe transport